MRVLVLLLALVAAALANPHSLEERQVEMNGRAVVIRSVVEADGQERVIAYKTPECARNHCLLAAIKGSVQGFCSSYINYATATITALATALTTVTTTTTTSNYYYTNGRYDQAHFMSMCSHKPSALSSACSCLLGPALAATTTSTTTSTGTATTTLVVETCYTSGQQCVPPESYAGCCSGICIIINGGIYLNQCA